MKSKNKTTIFTAGAMFVLGFILSQFTAAFGVVLIKQILILAGKTSAQIEVFFDSASGYLVQALCMNIAFVIMFVWFYKKYLIKAEVIEKPNKNTSIYVLICVCIGILTLFLLSGILNYFELFVKFIGKSANSVSYPLNTKNYLISLISLALIPAICEELFFRGVLVNSLKEKGDIFAIIFSSIMFAIFHFSLSQLLYPICFGLILSIVYLRTKNIFFPMLLHFVNNALTISIQYFSHTTSQFSHSFLNLMYAIITFAIWIVIMYYLFKDFKSHQKNNSSNVDLKNSYTLDLKTKKFNNLIFYGSIILMIVIYIVLICTY